MYLLLILEELHKCRCIDLVLVRNALEKLYSGKCAMPKNGVTSSL